MLLVPPPTTLRHTRYPLQVSNNMMTYLLINDINSATAIANPMMPLDNPSDLFAENACHNGFWRSAFLLRSIVEVAAAIGMMDPYKVPAGVAFGLLGMALASRKAKL